MDEDLSGSSDSYPSSDYEEYYDRKKAYLDKKIKYYDERIEYYNKEEEPETFDTAKKIIVDSKPKQTKIVLSSETKTKLQEIKEVQDKQENTEDKRTEKKEEQKLPEEAKTSEIETKSTEDKTKEVQDKQEKTEDKTTSAEKKEEQKILEEDKIESKEGDKEEEEEEEEDEDESELEDNNEESSKKQKKPDYDPKNVHYEGDLAIYTDPKSGYQYKWCNESNQWLPKSDVTYGFEDDVHTYTDTEGVKYFWDVDKNAWFPKIDDDFMARYQMSYGFVDNSTKDSQETKEGEKSEAAEKIEEKNEKEKSVKRKIVEPPPPPSWFEMSDQQNTKVYVSNLPTDITEQEFVDLMQKCGLVMRDLQTGKMKVKLYTVPETDILKGDGLCTYIKIESVELALNLLDGYVHRGKKLKVERAKFEMKGEYNPNLKPKKRRRKDKDKLKKMQEKLFDWRPEKMRGEKAKHERIVIIKNLFEPSLFDKDVSLILEYQQDLREECSKCGEVKRVLLYDRHPEGVAQITMKDPEQAEEVVTLLNGRWFGKRQLTAEIWNGKTKYKIAETDSEISKRLDNWDKFLETDETPPKTENQVAESTIKS